jgi:hypothetical protein
MGHNAGDAAGGGVVEQMYNTRLGHEVLQSKGFRDRELVKW